MASDDFEVSEKENQTFSLLKWKQRGKSQWLAQSSVSGIRSPGPTPIRGQHFELPEKALVFGRGWFLVMDEISSWCFPWGESPRQRLEAHSCPWGLEGSPPVLTCAWCTHSLGIPAAGQPVSFPGQPKLCTPCSELWWVQMLAVLLTHGMIFAF